MTSGLVLVQNHSVQKAPNGSVTKCKEFRTAPGEQGRKKWLLLFRPVYFLLERCCHLNDLRTSLLVADNVLHMLQFSNGCNDRDTYTLAAARF
jgi:hypothetical protein